MLKDITLGQYYQTDSVIHRLDARVKLVGTLVYMVSLLIFNNLICYGVAAVFLILVVTLSRVPVKFIFRGMRSILLLLFITVLYNVFLTNGTILVQLGIFTVTYEGLLTAVCMFFRLILLITGSSVLTLTTTPSRLTDGLESLMKPLKLFRVPVHEIAMMMSIALRFIPILMEETDKIMKAQLARGANLEDKNLFRRIQSFIPILVPLFVSAFRRAGDLALAMEARCYHGGEGRTRMRVMKLSGRDFAALAVLGIYLGAVLYFGIRLRTLDIYLVEQMMWFVNTKLR